MAELEPVPTPDLFYDYRGIQNDEPITPRTRPIHQGDIFRNIAIPGIVNPSGFAMLFLHPCTMRNNGRLIPYVTMLAVRSFPLDGQGNPPGYRAWEKGSYNDKMPLYELEGEEKPLFYANFLEIGTVDSNLLNQRDRMAGLALEGRLHLLHRTTYHFSRLAPSSNDFRAKTKRVEVELELQENWVEESLRIALTESGEDCDELLVITEAEDSFTDWIGKSPQSGLIRSNEPAGFAEVSRLCGLEIESWIATPDSQNKI